LTLDSQIPLIPANAGTQMEWPSASAINSELIPSASPPLDLGPGIRRDERFMG
jgi:hypothetical protein